MANFVKRLPRGTGSYKGKIPLKCFKCGRIFHFVAKYSHKEEKPNREKPQSKGRVMNKKNVFQRW